MAGAGFAAIGALRRNFHIEVTPLGDEPAIWTRRERRPARGAPTYGIVRLELDAGHVT